MTASGGLYPSLGRYFENLTELAHAGCMSRTRARECLDGLKPFNEDEKKAIAANIMAKLMSQNMLDYDELNDAFSAWQGNFDSIYKGKEYDGEATD